MKLDAHLLSRDTLTDKESSVLLFLCEGYSRKEIAKILHRSFSTVSKHVEAIAQKLDAHSHAEIVATAVAKGLVSISIRLMMMILISNVYFSPTQDLRSPPRPPCARSSRVTRYD